MTKTNRMAQITQRMCGRTDRIERRIWTDGKREFVKVNGWWFDLYKTYGAPYYTVETWYQPTGK